MARARRRSRLNVWMNGLDVGTWEQAPGGEHLFAYRDTWLEQPEARPLSLSMPLQSGAPYRGAIVEDWFENLLPDNREIRQRIQGRFGTSSTRAFDLLSEVGRDCIGAVQLVPEGEVPEAIEAIRGDPLDEYLLVRQGQRLYRFVSRHNLRFTCDEFFAIGAAGNRHYVRERKSNGMEHDLEYVGLFISLPIRNTSTLEISEGPNLGLLAGHEGNCRLGNNHL